MQLSLIFDVIVCVCLLSGFIYTLWFNRRLVAAHNSRQQFQNLLDSFSTALERGQKSLTELQEMNQRVADEIDQKMSTVSSLLEDLRFFGDRGENIMEHLEKQVRIARTVKNDFENLVRFHEETSSFSSALEETDTTPPPHTKSRYDHLPHETIFKTKARIDHPWGILQRKGASSLRGGSVS